MTKFTIDLRKIETSYATLSIEAPNLDAAKRMALDQVGWEEEEDENLWSLDERDITAWRAGDDIDDNDDVNRMRLGDAAYEAAGAPAKPD